MKSIFVICGGPGSEREVSLVSGENVYQAILANSFPCKKIIVLKNKNWLVDAKEISEEEGLEVVRGGLVFPIIHGTYGEDGELQQKLEERNISFVGSPSKVMRVTIDKEKTQELLSQHGIRIPQTIIVKKENYTSLQLPFSYPVIVKPNNEGSSVALYKVRDDAQLHDILEKELTMRNEMLVQEFVSGREFTCGVVELGGKVQPLIPTEVILTQGELFDYTAKYSVGGCVEVTPAEVDEQTTKRIQELALLVHTVSGCKDLSRTDMILNKEGELVVLEINTIPGMTNTSFIPAELRASSYSTEAFVKSMIEKYS